MHGLSLRGHGLLQRGSLLLLCNQILLQRGNLQLLRWEGLLEQGSLLLLHGEGLLECCKVSPQLLQADMKLFSILTRLEKNL